MRDTMFNEKQSVKEQKFYKALEVYLSVPK
jgi:hypothetical protein